ncbi:cadherin [Penaeus vannamei]|uniref:Cadherin n=1 Tax=Penaeus vannamei TaxID=6689 RepID=A0A423U2C1_PENVA|nr:cadherin [Penaeus vannamei]
MTTLEPILVNVTAQELRDSDTLVPEEMYTSHVEIAFVIMDSDMMIPKFVHEMAFIIKVKNPQLLDYETMSKIEFKLLARQVSGSAQGTGTTSIRINILDVNDNMPLTVEARDDNGVGNSATARILLHLKDINDKPPRFLEAIYTGVMTPDRASLKSPLRVQAVDDDAEEPNNQVVYSIDSGLFSQNFRVDRTSGEISVVQGLSYPQVAGLNTGRSERAFGNDEVIKFTVTASDQGTPQLSKSVPVQIFTQEFVDRFITFIYPKPPVEVGASKREIENQLETLTGESRKLRRSSLQRGRRHKVLFG